jgi:hypothetical protein
MVDAIEELARLLHPDAFAPGAPAGSSRLMMPVNREEVRTACAR